MADNVVQFRLVVNGQSISPYGDDQLVADSVNFVDVTFVMDDSWDGLECVAQFYQDDAAYNQVLQDGKCKLPTEIHAGSVEIGVFGQKGNVTIRSTTNKAIVQVQESSFHGDGQAPIPPTPDLYSQLLAQIEQAQTSTEESKQSASESAERAEEAAKVASNAAKEVVGAAKEVEEAKDRALDDIGQKVNEFNQSASDKQQELESISSHTPQINPATGKWQVWDKKSGAYVDTTTDAQGEKGDKGDPGEKGDKGDQGIQGPKGDDGLGVPQPTMNDIGKVPVVNNDGDGYKLQKVSVDPLIGTTATVTPDQVLSAIQGGQPVVIRAQANFEETQYQVTFTSFTSIYANDQAGVIGFSNTNGLVFCLMGFSSIEEGVSQWLDLAIYRERSVPSDGSNGEVLTNYGDGDYGWQPPSIVMARISGQIGSLTALDDYSSIVNAVSGGDAMLVLCFTSYNYLVVPARGIYNQFGENLTYIECQLPNIDGYYGSHVTVRWFSDGTVESTGNLYDAVLSLHDNGDGTCSFVNDRGSFKHLLNAAYYTSNSTFLVRMDSKVYTYTPRDINNNGDGTITVNCHGTATIYSTSYDAGRRIAIPYLRITGSIDNADQSENLPFVSGTYGTGGVATSEDSVGKFLRSVGSAVGAYEWIEAYTKEEADQKFAPIEAAIRPTVSGNPATLEHSVAWAMQGLNVYGKSTQQTTTGAQLFDASLINGIQDNGISATQNANGSIKVTGIIEKIQGTNLYSQKFHLNKGEYSIGLSVGVDFFVSIVPYGTTLAILECFPGITFAHGSIEDGDYVLRFYRETESNENINFEVYVMINSGSTALPWEPYTGGKPSPSPDYPQEIVTAGSDGSIDITISDGADQSQQLNIQTPNGLPGIPVDSGGNFTDAGGQQWICDEVDFQRGVYVQRIAQVEFDGSSDELWEMLTNGAAQRNYFRIAVEKAAFRYNGVDVLLCSAFPYMVYGYAEPSGDNTACFQSNNKTFACSTSLFDSVDDFRQYLSGNAMTLIYAIATPIETPLSAEELAAYAALRSYNGTTIVSTEAPVAGLSARYVADGAAYIDGKIQSAIASALEVN